MIFNLKQVYDYYYFYRFYFNFKSQDEEKTELEYDVTQNKSIYVDSTTSNEIYPEEESGYDGFEIELEYDEELEKTKNVTKNEIILTSTQKIKIKKSTGKFDIDLHNESFYSRNITSSKKPSVKEEDEKSNNSDISDEGEDYEDDDESDEGRDIDESFSEEDNELEEEKSSSESPETTIKTITPTTATKSTTFKATSKTEAARKAASLQTSTISKAARGVFTIANSGILFCLPFFFSLNIFVQYAAYLQLYFRCEQIFSYFS